MSALGAVSSGEQAAVQYENVSVVCGLFKQCLRFTDLFVAGKKDKDIALLFKRFAREPRRGRPTCFSPACGGIWIVSTGKALPGTAIEGMEPKTDSISADGSVADISRKARVVSQRRTAVEGERERQVRREGFVRGTRRR